jgi:hypothetical protein
MSGRGRGHVSCSFAGCSTGRGTCAGKHCAGCRQRWCNWICQMFFVFGDVAHIRLRSSTPCRATRPAHHQLLSAKAAGNRQMLISYLPSLCPCALPPACALRPAQEMCKRVLFTDAPFTNVSPSKRLTSASVYYTAHVPSLKGTKNLAVDPWGSSHQCQRWHHRGQSQHEQKCQTQWR